MDNADALKLGLHTLRQRISVIPQTPFLFKGSIKTNLDPFHEKDEEELWKVLEESGLKEAVEKVNNFFYDRWMTSCRPTSPMYQKCFQWVRNNFCV